MARAASDLGAGAHDLTAEDPFCEDAVFHAQQAAEKAMKAFLVWHDTPFRKTHDLAELGRQCADLEPTLAPLLQRAAPLSEYAWKFRYPGEQDESTREEAEEALALAREVYEAVLARLPEDAHP